MHGLAAAKGYYNLVNLKDTKVAIELLATVISNTNAPAAEQFRKQQLSSIVASDQLENVLESIVVDSAPFDGVIERLRDKFDSIDSQIGCGNVLLLADQPEEAQECFELALHLATKGKGGKGRLVRESLSGIARSIRAQDGSVQRADAYILSLQQQALSSTSGESSRAALMSRSIREAVAQIPPSNLIPLDIEMITKLSPANPTAKASAEPKLVEWLKVWQRTIEAGGDISPSQRVELDTLLSESQLGCIALIDIGRAIHFQSSDNLTTAAFYGRAAVLAEHELHGYSASAKGARPILIALNSTRPLLWRVVDGGHRNLVGALFTLNTQLIERISPTDRSLADARLHGKIGAAECLFLMGRIDAGVAAALAIETDALQPKQRADVAWTRGLLLFEAHRYSEAVPELRIVADHPKDHYAKAALKRLSLALSWRGNAKEASEAFDRWRQLASPSEVEVASVRSLMGERADPTRN